MLLACINVEGDSRGCTLTEDLVISNSTSLRAIVLAIIILAASVIGLCAGFLSWVGGATPVGAVLRGAAAAGATIALGITMWGFVHS